MSALTPSTHTVVTSAPRHFNPTARVLHWSMALLIVTMLFVGIGMVASMSLRPGLVSLHRPIGIAILMLAIVRGTNEFAILHRRCLQTCPPCRCWRPRHHTGCCMR